jgi:hypothetical protein
MYFLEGKDIDFVLKYDDDLSRVIPKQVREALLFDPNSPEETRQAIVLPRVRINGTTDPVEEHIVCEKPGICKQYILLGFFH